MSTTNFPIKVKEVVLTAEEYENVVEKMNKLKEEVTRHIKTIDDVNTFFKRVQENDMLKIVDNSKYGFDPENEIHIRIDQLGSQAEVHVSDKRN